MAPQSNEECRCVCNGCLCCYDACDCNNPIFCVMGSADCLCLRASYCIAVNAQPKGCGCTGDPQRGEVCKLGCFCGDVGIIKMPTKLCAFAKRVCCWITVASLPCCSQDYVPRPVCTVLPGVMICPVCGCCTAPDDCPALDLLMADQPSMDIVASQEMTRDDQVKKE